MLGKWQTPSMGVVDFYEDGTMTLRADQGASRSGRYTLLEGDKLLLDTGDSKSMLTYSFKDANTIIFSTGKDDGSVEELRRITHK